MEKTKVEWSLVSEDYEGRSDYSVLRLSEDRKRVLAECNGAGEWWDLEGEPVLNDSFEEPEYPVCVDDHFSVDEVCRSAFGVGVKKKV